MDESLAKEMADILECEDEATQSKCITRLIFYLLTLPPPSRAYHSIVRRFIERAFEMLPSSNLPQQLAKKLGVSEHRRRVVSFLSPTFFPLRSSENLSNEGRVQQARESESLSISNTDPQRRFSPKECFVDGMSFQTRHASLILHSLSNTFMPELKDPARCMAKISFDLDEILQDPSVLEMYK